MTNLTERYYSVRDTIPQGVDLVVVSKKNPVEKIKAIYDSGQHAFGENKVMELMDKKDLLPADIQWHIIGHLQTNKVKYIAPFVHLIQSLDSTKLAAEIDKQAKKCNRVIDCLLEIFIASEETKFGFSLEEAENFLANELPILPNIRITGFMGMASNTPNIEQVRLEFRSLANFYKKYEKALGFQHLSMGMTSDYKIAIEEGSNMVRIGSAIFNE
ncbi:MAG TPA: YggS family pyridoxal phosphate-dependent enzyme [Bacteroidia bacterium]|jgi:pyridoxal phosphate enzyme (YggS family)|nr:YggS family pyridoxal phosphate-dependent enzyme [Bacteroidia bacterium]